jgi:hypothetical protein
METTSEIPKLETGADREELESGEQIVHVEETDGADGKPR